MTSRLPLLAAIAFAVLLGLGSSLAPQPPGVLAPGGEVVAWATQHAGSIRAQGWLVMLASLPGGALVAIVHRRMHGPEATAYLVGAVASVALLASAVLLRLALARQGAAELQDADARLLLDVAAYTAPLLTFPIALQALALAVAARRGAFAKWLGVLSLVLAAEQLVESVTLFGSKGLFAPGGDLNTLVGPTLYLAWIIAQGIAATRR